MGTTTSTFVPEDWELVETAAGTNPRHLVTHLKMELKKERLSLQHIAGAILGNRLHITIQDEGTPGFTRFEDIQGPTRVRFNLVVNSSDGRSIAHQLRDMFWKCLDLR
jgi:hypothetical protein